jgi:hypothetical protein
MSRWLAVGVMMIACGGGSSGGRGGNDAGSGLSGGKRIADLTADEVRQICEYSLEQEGEMRTVECPDGTDRTAGGQDVGACIASVDALRPTYDRCGLTVAELERCVDALAAQTDAQICADATPTECDIVNACFDQSRIRP